MANLNIPEWLKKLGEDFKESGFELSIVGGAIRNQLLNLPVKEWDLTTNARPDKIEQIIRSFGCKKIGTIGKRFGTITGEFNSEPIEVTTYRSEDYSIDSRKPIVEFGSSLEEDLARRDFTVNAIAYDLEKNKLIDPYDGQGDIEDKIIRSVGDARDRFNEDPLRMLRAIRFMVQLNFEIEPETLGGIKVEKERFAILSSERVAGEMDKILLASKPSRAIEVMVETGLINYILPELLPSINIEFEAHQHKDIYHHILQVLDQTPPIIELRWCALLHDIAKPQTRRRVGNEWHFLGHENVGSRTAKNVLRRLKYSNEFVDYVSKLVYLHQRIPNDDGLWTDGAVRRFVRDAGETLDDLFAFAEADSTGGNQVKLAKYKAGRDKLKERIAKLEEEAEIAKIKSPLSGEELMEMFHRPAGAWIKPIKEKLLEMVLDGELKEDDKEKAAEIARQLVRDNPIQT